MENTSDDKIFHSYNYKNKDGTRKIIQSGEPCVSVGAKSYTEEDFQKLEEEEIPSRKVISKEKTLLLILKQVKINYGTN